MSFATPSPSQPANIGGESNTNAQIELSVRPPLQTMRMAECLCYDLARQRTRQWSFVTNWEMMQLFYHTPHQVHIIAAAHNTA
jgi:hypothetical protein